MQVVESQSINFLQKGNIIVDGKTLKQLRLQKGLSQQELSDATGVPLGTIGRIEATNDEIKKVATNRIFEDFFKNAKFGTQNEEKNPDKTDRVNTTDPRNSNNFVSDTVSIGEMPGPGEDNTLIEVGAGRFVMVVPLVPIKAYAGYIDNYNNQEFFEGLSVHTLSVTNNYKGRYMAFVVKGESMSNGTDESINEGDIVTGREIQRHHWRNKLHLHRFEDYVIVHKDGIVTKRIIAHDVEQGIITCRSLNPDKNRFPDYPIFLDDCIQIFNIVAVTKTK